MRPIEGYDQVNEAGEFRKLPAGIYGVRITKVVDVPSSEYLEIYCDITKGEFAGYFKNLVANGMRDSSLHIRSYKTKALPFFKKFITAIEKSNEGYHWDWDEQKLVGKGAVAVFRDEEYVGSDGQVHVGSKLYEFRSVQAFKEGVITVPPLKKLDEVPAEKPQPEPELTDDDLPF